MRTNADPISTSLRLAMLVALYAIPAVVTLRPIGDPIFDPDIWWHLRVGQWVVEHGTVPVLDPFSQVHRPWVAYSWLYEVLIYGLYSVFGLAGIIAYRVVMALAIALALHRLIARREPRFLVATGLTAIALLAIAMLFSERPWLFTILFSILTLSAILDLREGRPSWLAPCLPVVFVLWANIHIQFVYGLALLALACIAPALDRWLHLDNRTDSAATLASPAWRRLVILSVLCLLATLINPYHVRIYEVVAEYATQPGAFRFVNELKALEFRELCDWVMLALFAAAVFALGRRSRLSIFDVLLLAMAGVLAFRARRDLWFLVVASLVSITPAGRSAEPAAIFRLTKPRLALVVAELLIVIAITAWARGLSRDKLEEKVAGVFPVAAARFVAEHGYRGPLFNDFNWGGYLIWALPNLPVVIDGRTNLHGDERIERIGNTWAGGPGWQADADLAASGVVIAPADAPLAELLASDGRFAAIYDDALARVFVRQSRLPATVPSER